MAAAKKRIRRQINTNIDFDFGSPVVKKGLAVLLAVLVLTVLCYQIIARSKSQKLLPTETALVSTYYRSITAQAAAVRSETVLSHSVTGTVVPMVSNGSKVAINDTVARIFSDPEDAKRASAHANLDEEIRYYEDIAALSDGNLVAGVDMYSSNVTKRLIEMQNCVERGDLSAFPDAVMEFSESVTKKQIAVGESVDVGQKLQSLYAQLNQMNDSSGSYSSVTAPASGYYVNSVDGYENIYDMSSGASVASLSAADIDSILNSSQSFGGSNVGKLITEFNWYLVCVVGEAEADGLEVGDNVKISVDELGGATVSMKLKAKNIGADSRAALVFSSNEMNSQLASLRFSQIKIRTEEYKGYTLAKTAVRTVNGERGVYIQLGNIIRFRKINIIYSDDNIFVAAESDEDGYLKLYDEVIIEGTENNDGKLVF